jgi:hypothetical protein
MGTKTLTWYPDGTSVFSDTRTLAEAKTENLGRWREITTKLIFEAGYDEIWQRNAALVGVLPPEEVGKGTQFIAACRNEYLRCKALILAAQTNDEADAVQFVAPPVPEGI